MEIYICVDADAHEVGDFFQERVDRLSLPCVSPAPDLMHEVGRVAIMIMWLLLRSRFIERDFYSEEIQKIDGWMECDIR